jgi:FAD synthetase
MTANGAHVELDGGNTAQQQREFTLEDAVAVYKLSEESSALGHKVKDALEIIDQAIADYG